MHCPIYIVLANKYENLYKNWPLQMHKKSQTQR